MKRKKLQCLLYTLVFCLALCSHALAADDLIAWSNNPAPETSDNESIDVATLECIVEDTKHLRVTINNAYPLYEGTVTAKIVNTTSDQVQITDVVIDPILEDISVDISDLAGNSLIDKTLNANESIIAKLITRVEESASQNTKYEFTIRIDARQEVSEYEPPSGGVGGGGGGGFPNEPEEPVVIPPGGEPLSPGEGPGEQQQEPVVIPTLPEALAELPYTGGNVALFIGTALSLGCIGLVMRYKP